MEFADVLKKRYSVRAYDPRPIEPAKLQRVLQAALMAPTAMDILVVTAFPLRHHQKTIGTILAPSCTSPLVSRCGTVISSHHVFPRYQLSPNASSIHI